MNLQTARDFILEELKTELPSSYAFHGYERTLQVLKDTRLLLGAEKITGEKADMAETAALFVDAGYLKGYEDAPENAVNILRNQLPAMGYSLRQILLISGMVIATRPPQVPQNHLEKIVCDASTGFMGKPGYHQQVKKLRFELEVRGKIITDHEWQRYQFNLLNNHRFFTATARKLWEDEKQKVIGQLKPHYA